MHDATVDQVQLNTLYVRKDSNNDRWSLIVMRKSPLNNKSKNSYTKLVPVIFEYWWRPRHKTRAGRVNWKCLGSPPLISGLFFRLGTSLALRVWSLTFMKSWRSNTPGRRYHGMKESLRRQEDEIDPQDWILDVIYELDHKWFRRVNFISQAIALTRWMYGHHLTEYILKSNLSEVS
jgi:hypothetical protein